MVADHPVQGPDHHSAEHPPPGEEVVAPHHPGSQHILLRHGVVAKPTLLLEEHLSLHQNQLHPILEALVPSQHQLDLEVLDPNLRQQVSEQVGSQLQLNLGLGSKPLRGLVLLVE